jgi:ABC-type cobalamin/Fe3+-siderophores transport system ATPase subunit
MLKIESLSVNYGSHRILNDVSLNVQSGEVVALIGPNGAGKSTLIRAVSGVIPIVSGSIRTNDDDFHSLTPTRRAKYLAVVPQAVSLPPAFTVWETVLMGRTPYLGFIGQTSPNDDEIARDALKRVDALNLSDRRVGELSGGEAQRILLARALCQSTPILLLDEPTTHLDLQYQVNFLQLIHELAHHDDLAVLIALHDLNLAAHYADRVALMVAGVIRASGTPREVLTAELISQAYCLPVQVIKHPFADAPLVLPESKPH